MNESGHAPALLTVLITGLVLWRMYSRMRRSLGRQQLTPTRPRVLVVLYPLIAALLAWGARTQPLALAALAGGLAAGAGLGLYGLKVTRFEATPEGLHYTPSSPIGVGLLLLLVGRFIYRLAVAPSYGAPGGVAGPPALTPLTMLAIAPVLGYYATYYIGLLRWRTQVLESRSALAQPPL